MKTLRASFLASLLLVSIVVADDPPGKSSSHSRPLPPLDEAGERQLEEDFRQFQDDIKRINIKMMSTFHMLLTRKCIKGLPDSCRANYLGALRLEDGRNKQIIHGDEGGNLLTWHVEDDDGVIFDVHLSLKRRSQTVTSVKIDDLTLHVNVMYVDRSTPLNMPLRRLGGLSVRDALKPIHEADEHP
jgi:hypothetical protein